ncbi:hypothetical protein DL93DRAFT_2081168 [Clavulina sp. PMI_390]|nr:hypothetical protein DL93DRAFT_2081168 [Clavulina sp. PMI_390]
MDHHEDGEEGDEYSTPLVTSRAFAYAQMDDGASQLEDSLSTEDGSFTTEYTAANIPRRSAGFRGVEAYEELASSRQSDGSSPSRAQQPRSSGQWQHMKLLPKGRPIDPFSDVEKSADASYGAVPIGLGRPNHPLSQYSQQTGTTQTTSSHSTGFPSSYHTAATSNSHDYDPERYAVDSTPKKPFALSRKSIPRSRSPTPVETPPRTTQYYFPSSSALTRRVFSGKENEPSANTRNEPRPMFDALKTQPVANSSPVVDATTMHFGLPPKKQRRRNQGARKLVPLTHGNFVDELEVPPNIVMPEKNLEESMSVRYTGVTCDPDEFVDKNYFLRQNISGRETELAIVITMFNEDEVLLCRTLYGVMKNIQELSERKSSRTWGKDAWKKVVVVIIADGRRNIHPRVLDCLSILGIYQSGPHMGNTVLGEEVTAHLFEYTTTMCLDPDISFQLATPMQVIFCLKEKNTKKINSHRWFFSAFCRLLEPNVCVLLDVGTRPGPKSLYRLWKTFDLNSNVGGACGEIAVYKGKWWRGLLNPLVAAQNFEYKMSNILDKPMESMLGYITVLPGAFSAYRYIALQNDEDGVGPLASYFKGEIVDGNQHDIFTRNMYLAEDRILCFELAAKEGQDYILRYVKGATGETDVPHGLPEFISQRRRWLNGSLFASLYAIAHFWQVLRTDHSPLRKFVLVVEEVYNAIMLLFGWFAIANYYCFFTIVTSSLEDPKIGASSLTFVNSIVQYLFAAAIAACFIFSMGNKPTGSKWKYKSTALFFAALSMYMIVAAILCAIHVAKTTGEHGALYAQMKLSVVATFGFWVVSSILAMDPWHLLTSGIAYLLLSPSYIIILNTFAFGNLDDISWGTKQQHIESHDLGNVSAAMRATRTNIVEVELPADTKQPSAETQYTEALGNLRGRKPVQEIASDLYAEQAAKDYYANIRTNVLLAWVLSNGVLVVGVLGSGSPASTFASGSEGAVTRTYMTVILVFVAITSCFRFAGSTLFLIVRLFTG